MFYYLKIIVGKYTSKSSHENLQEVTVIDALEGEYGT